MTTLSTFTPSDNDRIDLSLHTQLPSPTTINTQEYLESYLTHRQTPLLRPCPYAPYTQLDYAVHSYILSVSPETLSITYLAQILDLFPIHTLTPFFDHLQTCIPKLVLFISRSINNPTTKTISQLHALASVGSIPTLRNIIINALSTRNRREDAVNKVRGWLDAIPTNMNKNSNQSQSLTPIQPSIVEIANGTTLLLLDRLLLIPNASTSTSNIEQYIPLVQWKQASETPRAGEAVGKRAPGHGRRLRMEDISSFGAKDGDSVELEWYARRMARQQAQEELLEETNELDILEQKNIIDNNIDLGLGVYDDEPDEGVLQGEIAMKELMTDDGSKMESISRGWQMDDADLMEVDDAPLGLTVGKAVIQSKTQGRQDRMEGGRGEDENNENRSQRGRGRGRGRGGRGRGSNSNRGGGGRGRGRNHRRDQASRKQSRGM